MRWMGRVVLVWGVCCSMTEVCLAQLSAADIEALRAQGVREGWTFEVSENDATVYPLEQLCGLVVPDNWRDMAPWDDGSPNRDLPASFDWRTVTGCPPVRNQGGCGSCWAFATVGPLECNILIKDGIVVDLSEQWLVSCNRSGWSCSGGWWAHDYHRSATDSCGGTGAVMESAFPYTATNAACNCPYPHSYFITRWASISGGTTGIKQAIMAYGPVTVAVYVNSAFQAYHGGVFNGCASGQVNHGVTLVGWDDNQGTNGVWFMRNSWGSGWGEGGYMRIPYDCSQIGYGACYIDYPGKPGLEVSPTAGLEADGQPGGPFVPTSANYTLKNNGTTAFNYQVSKSQTWVSLSSTGGTLAPGATTVVTVSLNDATNLLGNGVYTDTVQFINTTDHHGDTSRTVTANVGGPAPVYRWDMDTDPGWSATGQWAWGTPLGAGAGTGGPDPTSGYTGTKVYGYNLSGGYTNNMPRYSLTTSPINCSGLTQVSLHFWRWLGVQQSSSDQAGIWFSLDGSVWIQVWQNPGYNIDDQTWVHQRVDLSQYADNRPSFLLRWTMGPTDGAGTYCGWNIDDVEIWGYSPAPPIILGDLNCDGVVNNQDIDHFVQALFNTSDYVADHDGDPYPSCSVLAGDFSGDGVVNSQDIDGFVAVLFGG